MRSMTETVPSGSASDEDSNVHMNYALVSALVAFAVAQAIKVFTTWYVFSFIIISDFWICLYSCFS